MIDDQVEKYAVSYLKKIKLDHEKRVSEALRSQGQQGPIKIRQIKKNIPAALTQIRNGKELLNLVLGALAYRFDHAELESNEEAEVIAAFLQNAQDWGEISSELEAGERVRAGFALNESIKELSEAGFIAFGAREVQRIEGGVGAPGSWPVAILRVLRAAELKEG
jgi:hypothetical protein